MDAKKRYTEEQIIGFLKEADRSVAVKQLRRRLISEPSAWPPTALLVCLTHRSIRFATASPRTKAQDGCRGKKALGLVQAKVGVLVASLQGRNVSSYSYHIFFKSM